jgi:hypothetical protein
VSCIDYEADLFGCHYLFWVNFLCEICTWLEVRRFRRVARRLHLLRREVPHVSRDCLLVVVTSSSCYMYCSRNWDILSVEVGGVRCIEKDRAKSVA